MTDIVERLRCLDITLQFSGGQHEVINAAIDEIERLQNGYHRRGEQIESLEQEIERLQTRNSLLEDVARAARFVSAKHAWGPDKFGHWADLRLALHTLEQTDDSK